MSGQPAASQSRGWAGTHRINYLSGGLEREGHPTCIRSKELVHQLGKAAALRWIAIPHNDVVFLPNTTKSRAVSHKDTNAVHEAHFMKRESHRRA